MHPGTHSSKSARWVHGLLLYSAALCKPSSYLPRALCCSQTHCFLSPWPLSPLSHCPLILVCCPRSQPAPTLLPVSTSKSCCSFGTCLYGTPSPTQGCTSQLDTITPSLCPRPHILLARVFCRGLCFVSARDWKLSREGCMSRSVFPQCWPYMQGGLDARWSMNEGVKE